MILKTYVTLTLHSCRLCIACHWQFPGGWEFDCLWSWESHHKQQWLQEGQRFNTNVRRVVSMINWTCVYVCTPPVPLRHCIVVVNPLVRGSRWYLSLGRPLLSATCILIWCFFSVKRVPSQYSRNYGGRRSVLIHIHTYNYSIHCIFNVRLSCPIRYPTNSTAMLIYGLCLFEHNTTLTLSYTLTILQSVCLSEQMGIPATTWMPLVYFKSKEMFYITKRRLFMHSGET